MKYQLVFDLFHLEQLFGAAYLDKREDVDRYAAAINRLFIDAEQLPNVIVCVQEQDWEATQTAPSDRAELVAFQGYVEGLNRSSALAEWLKRDYKLNDSEVALFLGAVLKYDVTELVDPHFNVVAKVPKSALRAFQ